MCIRDRLGVFGLYLFKIVIGTYGNFADEYAKYDTKALKRTLSKLGYSYGGEMEGIGEDDDEDEAADETADSTEHPAADVAENIIAEIYACKNITELNDLWSKTLPRCKKLPGVGDAKDEVKARFETRGAGKKGDK